MSLVKLAATKWKSMIDELSNSSINRLKSIIPTKDRYIQGMQTGINNRKTALSKKYGINIHEKLMNSKTMDMEQFIPGAGKVKIPLPIVTVPMDSKNYLIVAPRSHASSVTNLGNLLSKNDSKMMYLQAKQHELSEISQMAKHVAKKDPIHLPQRTIDKGVKSLHSLTQSEMESFNPHLLDQNYHSHFNKKVLNTDINFAKKNPFKNIRISTRDRLAGEIR